jgi:hypothetical protein
VSERRRKRWYHCLLDPVMNDGHRGLSLSRLFALALAVTLIRLLWSRPDLLATIAWPGAALVLGIFLVLFADVIGGKALSSDAVRGLVSRFSVGGPDPAAPPAAPPAVPPAPDPADPDAAG